MFYCVFLQILLLFSLATSFANLVVTAKPRSTPTGVGSSINPKHATLSDIVVLVDPLILSESIVSNNLLVFLNLFSSFLNFLKTSRTFLKHDCCSVSKKLKFLTSFNFSAPIFSHFWKSVLILG